MAARPRRSDADALLVRRTVLRVGLWIAVTVALLVILALGAAFWIVSRQIPLAALFTGGRREDMIDVGGSDIILGAAVVGFGAVVLIGGASALVTRLAVSPLIDALERQRRFVADASHELRTPLTVLDTRIQLLERSMTEDDPHRAIVEELRGDSRGLIRVVDDLLDGVSMPTDAATDPVPVDAAILSAVEDMRVLAADRGVRIDAEGAASALLVSVGEVTLHRALVAVLDNAIKHSPAGGAVTVTTTATRTRVEIAIADEGPGIRGISPDRVFDRFARSSDAVDGGGSTQTGFGLGLFLVRDSLNRFGGDATVTETSERGTTITLQLPRG